MKYLEASSNADHYHYRECGLDNVWLVNGASLESTPYGKGVSIPHIEGLHSYIAQTLCDKPSPLTGREFRFLRKELDFSQKLLGEMFGRTERMIRDTESKEEVKEPYNLFIRHLYLESIRPDSSYTELFERLRTLDTEWHQDMTLAPNENGAWSAVRLG